MWRSLAGGLGKTQRSFDSLRSLRMTILVGWPEKWVVREGDPREPQPSDSAFSALVPQKLPRHPDQDHRGKLHTRKTRKHGPPACAAARRDQLRIVKTDRRGRC